MAKRKEGARVEVVLPAATRDALAFVVDVLGVDLATYVRIAVARAVAEDRVRLSSLDDVDPAQQPLVKERRRGRVYFVRGGDFLKIGWSRDVDGRIGDLRASGPTQLTLLGSIAGTRDDERALHERFAEIRHHGEWFRAEPELLDFVASVLA